MVNSAMIPTADRLLRYIVPTFTHTLFYTLYRQFLRVEPKEKKCHFITLSLCLPNRLLVSRSSQRRLYRKISFFRNQLVDTSQHDFSGLYGYIFRLERRNPMGYCICIDELVTIKHFRQHVERSGRFPRTITTRYDIQIRHASNIGNRSKPPAPALQSASRGLFCVW
jgi:hypothetical protein